MNYKHLILLAWLAFVVVSSLLPPSAMPSVTLFKHGDKIVHFTFYCVATYLYFWSNARLSWLAMIQMALLGWLLEILQHFSGWRHGDIYDGIANMCGVIAAFLLFELIAVIKKRY